MKQQAFVISMLLGASSASSIKQQGVTGSGFPGALDFKVSPAANTCTNANKATTDDEDCSTAGNSAWNTITSSRTAKPADAMAAPYPGHTEHVQLEYGNLAQFDSGSSIDHYPPYVPTNNAYPKIYDGRAKTAPAVETQTPPADTAAPEAVGWYKDAWYNTGSKHSFGNLAQFDSGSSIDHYPPYVPTNNAYPKIFDARAKTAPAVETQTPPADTAAPEAVGWYKPAWYSSGSKHSFGNLAQFDSGSSIDHFPPYVPTNNAYPKIYDGRAKTAPAVETQTPPADTAAPEAVGWYKDAWYNTGSKHSFGNLAQFDSGSSNDHFPPYVPTNNAYPKIYDGRAKTAPAVETQTPPADTAAPEAVGWYKDAWYSSGSKHSFGNLLQLDAEGVTGSGFPGALDFKVSPAANTCTNANKATTDDEDCSTDGNSAWNTITSSRTAKPADAMASPYPGHTEH